MYSLLNTSLSIVQVFIFPYTDNISKVLFILTFLIFIYAKNSNVTFSVVFVVVFSGSIVK